MRKSTAQFLAPALTLAILAGLGLHNLLRARAADAEPYHQRVRLVAAELPLSFGNWTGHEVEVPEGATALLRPNVMISRSYTNNQNGHNVHFLLVHCGDARSMWGHYPPVCYAGQGWQMVAQTPRHTDVNGLSVPQMEYEFVRNSTGLTQEQVIYDLMLLPDGKIVRDMDSLLGAYKDYTRRFYGAAQMQLVFAADIPPEEREETVREFLTVSRPLMDTILAGVKR
ncbi:MAG: exosortase-associated EpsI family protein [Phycisphaerae bacterium]